MMSLGVQRNVQLLDINLSKEVNHSERKGRGRTPERPGEKKSVQGSSSVNSIRLPPPPSSSSSSSSCHRSIPVRPLISHEPLGDWVNSSKLCPLSTEFIYTNTRARTLDCTRALTFGMHSHARARSLAVLCVLHNTCVYNDGGWMSRLLGKNLQATGFRVLQESVQHHFLCSERCLPVKRAPLFTLSGLF